MGLSFNLGRLSPSLFTDSSLNVGIGAAPSGSYKLEVTGTGKVSGQLNTNNIIVTGTTGALFGGNAATTAAVYGYINNTTGRFYFGTESSTGGTITTGSTAYYGQIAAQGLQLSANTGGNVHMTITPSGNVGIGTNAPNSSGYGNLVLTIGNGSTKIDNAIELFGSSGVDGGLGDIAFLNGADTSADKRMAVIRCNRDSNNTSGAILFYTKNTGSFQLSNRITSTGKIISACTENSFTYDMTNSNATSPSGLQIGLSGGVFNNTTQRFIECYTSNGDKFRVYTNGNVVNSNNSYGPLSDIKLKENITDTSAKLDKLMQVRIVNYNLINDPELKQIGVIAQELEQVFPGLVDEHQDTDREGNDLGTTTKSVKMSVFVPILIKAMQEQNQIIQELNERLNKAGL
jgi:hypothetical protein